MKANGLPASRIIGLAGDGWLWRRDQVVSIANSEGRSWKTGEYEPDWQLMLWPWKKILSRPATIAGGNVDMNFSKINPVELGEKPPNALFMLSARPARR